MNRYEAVIRGRDDVEVIEAFDIEDALQDLVGRGEVISIELAERGLARSSMTADEILADLAERCDRAVEELNNIRQSAPQIPATSPLRLIGKADGIKLVRDWLRSYDTKPEDRSDLIANERAVVLPPPTPCETCGGSGVVGGETDQANDLPWPCPDCFDLMPRNKRGIVIDPTKSARSDS